MLRNIQNKNKASCSALRRPRRLTTRLVRATPIPVRLRTIFNLQLIVEGISGFCPRIIIFRANCVDIFNFVLSEKHFTQNGDEEFSELCEDVGARPANSPIWGDFWKNS